MDVLFGGDCVGREEATAATTTDVTTNVITTLPIRSEIIILAGRLLEEP